MVTNLSVLRQGHGLTPAKINETIGFLENLNSSKNQAGSHFAEFQGWKAAFIAKSSKFSKKTIKILEYTAVCLKKKCFFKNKPKSVENLENS